MVPLAWQQQHVKSFRDIDYFYRTKRGQARRKRVLLAQITGTLYTEYAENGFALGLVKKYTWLEMQRNLKKARWEYPELRELYLNYYDPNKEHKQLGLRQYGSDYLINGGNNRLCTWKFAEKESILVEVEEYVFDAELYAAWKELPTQHIDIVRLDENQVDPQGFWKLQLGELSVTCMGREEVLSFAQTYANLAAQGLAWLWLRLTYQRHLSLEEASSTVKWQIGVTEHIPWFKRDCLPYLLAYKMKQELL
jgi:hypothetical protein